MSDWPRVDAKSLLGFTWVAPGTIGSTTPNTGAFTTLSATGQITSTLATGTPPLVVASTTQVANLYAARAALADVATLNANLTGPITSVGNATSIAAQTGTGTTFVMRTSANLITPDLGAATGISVALTPAAASIGRGFTVTQSGPTSGVSTPHDAFGVHFNHIFIGSDQTNLSNAASSVNGLFLYYAVGGANTKGQRNGIFAYVQKVGGSAVGGDTVGVGTFAIATATDGGTDTGAGARGAMFGGAFNGDLQSGATNYYLVSGAEITAAIASGGSARYMFGVSLVNRGTVHAAGLEAALEVGAVSAGWNNGIIFTNIHSAVPLSTTASVLGTDGSAVTVTNFAKFDTYTFTGDLLHFPNFRVTGAGVLSASVVGVSGTAAAVQLGARNTGSSFIDYADADIRHFFSSAAGADAAALTSAGAFSAKALSLAAAANTTPVTVTGYSVTGSGTTPLVSWAGIWNSSGSPVAILLDVTNTASGAAAALLDLRIGGASRMSVSKDGTITSAGVGAGVVYSPRNSGASFVTYVDANAFHWYSGAADIATLTTGGIFSIAGVVAGVSYGARATGALFVTYVDANAFHFFSGSADVATLSTGGIFTQIANAGTPPSAITGTLHRIIQADATTNAIEMLSAAGANILIGRRCGNTLASPAATAINANLIMLQIAGYDTTWTATYSAIAVRANQLWAAGANGMRIEFSTTPDGSVASAIVLTLTSTAHLQIAKALVALGGGAAPTLGTIGGSGPATAAQNTWLEIKDSAGNICWLPVWK